MDASAGRFTQQDTWMGNAANPITLNKFQSANEGRDYGPQAAIGTIATLPVVALGFLGWAVGGMGAVIDSVTET